MNTLTKAVLGFGLFALALATGCRRETTDDRLTPEGRYREDVFGAVVDFWGGMEDITAMESGEVALIIIHGTLDQVVPFTFAQQLVAQAQTVGVPYEFHPLEGSGHSAWQFMEQFIAWITLFLYQHLIG